MYTIGIPEEKRDKMGKKKYLKRQGPKISQE